MWKLIANAVAFNLCWFGLVLQGNWAVPLVLLWVATHIVLQKAPWLELRLIATVTSIGVLTDSLLVQTGVLVFSHSLLVLPLWMAALWISFATTLNHSLQVLRRSRVLRILAALIGVPSSYLLGSRLGNVELGLSLPATYVVFAVTWIFLLEVFARLPFYTANKNNTSPRFTSETPS